MVRTRSARLGVLIAVLVALLSPFAAGPAAAHSGGRAVVLVRNFTVDPSGDSWQANVTLADNDSGSPIRGSRVSVLQGTKEIVLDHGATAGLYTGTIKAKPGPLSLALKVRAQPGAEPVLPFDGKWDVQLVAGESVTVVKGGGGGGSNLPLIMGVAAAVLAVALLYGLYSVRRRTAVPVQK